MIIRSPEPVTLVGASVTSGTDFDQALAVGSLLVAADGGAEIALSRGVVPDAVIGDFDSLADHVRERLPPDRLYHVPEQESTDFDKALRHIDAPLVLAVGFTGRRIDHELATYNALARHAGRRTIVIGGHDICFHLPAELELELPVGTRLSLFPLARMRCFSSGLTWPTEGLILDPIGRVGTSNSVASDTVVLRPDASGMLVILPRLALGSAIRALLG